MSLIRCSAQMVCKTIKKLPEKKKIFIRDIGFGSLLTDAYFRDDKDLALWLVHKVNMDTFSLDVKGTSIDIRNMIGKILGLPSGPSKVPTSGQVEVPRALRSKFTSTVPGNSKGLEIPVARDMLLEEEQEEQFKQAFTLFILSTFLCPDATWVINRHFLSAVVDVGSIHCMDWCSFVADHLEKGIRRYRNSEVKRVAGCVYILVVLYIDYVKTNGTVVPFGYPRIAHVTQAHHDRVCHEDILEMTPSKQFGKLPILAFSDTAYAQQEPSFPENIQSELNLMASSVLALGNESCDTCDEDNEVTGIQKSTERAKEVMSCIVDTSSSEAGTSLIARTNSKTKIPDISFDEIFTKNCVLTTSSSSPSSFKHVEMQMDINNDALVTSPGDDVEPHLISTSDDKVNLYTEPSTTSAINIACQAHCEHNASVQSPSCIYQVPSLPHQGAIVDMSDPTSTSSFRLKEYAPKVCDGMHLAFAILTESIKKLRIHDDEQVFQEKMRNLLLFESNGVQVGALRSCLENLLKIKRCHHEHNNMKAGLESRKLEKELLNGCLEQKEAVYDCSIELLEKKIKGYRDMKLLLATEKTANDSEIAKCEANIKLVDESCMSAESDFERATAGLC